MDDISAESTSLDLSWIDEEEMLLRYQSFLQPSPLESISIQCVFLDCSNHIVGTNRFMQDLNMDTDNSILSTEMLSSIFLKYRYGISGEEINTTGKVNYSAEEVLLYNIDLTTEHLQNIGDIGNIPLKSVWSGGEIKNIVIVSSLPIFHSIQSVFIFMRETHAPKLVKSILKPTSLANRCSTKRVRIHPDTFKTNITGKSGKTRKRAVL